MICEREIREYYHRLNHSGCGITEFVAIKYKIVATGFFDTEGSFLAACRTFKDYNLYAGRNPRPAFFASSGLSLAKKRARDRDIKCLTAISLDIDPIRPHKQASSDKQHRTAIGFALKVQRELGGWVDDSGNGAYVWIPFFTPVEVTPEILQSLKKRFHVWQEDIKRRFQPERCNLKIDGCYDFSRIKRIIGSSNLSAGRISRFVSKGKPDDRIRDQILSTNVPPSTNDESCFRPTQLPLQFKDLLKSDDNIRQIWSYSNGGRDVSSCDWLLGQCCIEAGIKQPDELIGILANNPNGKYMRDRRKDYLIRTVEKLCTANISPKRFK